MTEEGRVPAASLAASAGVRDIPATSFVVPPRRGSLIDRDRMVKSVLEPEAPILEVVAPPGFGKSTALVLCAEADDRPYAWVQLSEADDDAVHLGRHLALALDRLAPLEPADGARIVGAGRSALGDIFPALAGVLADRSPCVVVLDDVHHLTSSEAEAGLQMLLSSVPEGSTVVLVGRRIPIALGRHRMDGRVHRVEASDLAMGLIEAAELFGRAGVSLDDEELADLVTRVEGWPGGLHLAALALHQGRNPRSFSGADRLVAEYLIEEVLDGTEPEMVSFMEGSAVLDRMAADELDELLERSDSSRMLGSIEGHGNLFLIPLDHDGQRFRYHHLFRDHLLQRLRRDDPDRALELERRASGMRARSGDVDSAVRHAVRACDRERAAGLILGSVLDRWLDGRLGQVGEWLDLLGTGAVDEIPEAAIAAAWCAVAAGDRDGAERSCRAAARFADHGPLSDGTPTVEVALAAVRMLMGSRGVDRVVSDAEVVRQAGGPGVNRLWALATGTQGSAYAMLGRPDLARERLSEAIDAVGETPYVRAVGLALLAVLALQDGELATAVTLSRSARSTADAHGLECFAPAISVYAVDALVAANDRRPGDARAAAAIAGATVERLGDLSPRTALLALILLARTAVAVGDRPGARRLLGEAQEARRRDSSASALNAQLAELESCLGSGRDLDRVDVEALTVAEQRVLELLPTHLPQGMIASELHVSRNTVKTHTASIYRKLGVTSRADAVDVARSVGLLA